MLSYLANPDSLLNSCSIGLPYSVFYSQTFPVSYFEDNYINLDRIHYFVDCARKWKCTSGYNSYCKTGNRMSVRSLSGGVFRPRGALARALYEKHQNDCKLRQLDKHDWYRCDVSLLNEEVGSRFNELSPDDDTRDFIRNSIEKSSWMWTQIWHCLAKTFLSVFMTRTDINGWLGRGSMFVLSAGQLSRLLGARRAQGARGALLDVGAGDGEVTRPWQPLFTQLYATEMSRSMRKLLEAKGFKILETDGWWKTNKFEVISMLNLLDRCSEPETMLLNAKQALDDDGVMIIALVLPFKPYVEYEADHSPKELLPIQGNTFEKQAESFIEYCKYHIGLELLQWSRVPYLCEGDFNQSYYWLNDAIFIMKKDTYRNSNTI